jgi:hypothetical protein
LRSPQKKRGFLTDYSPSCFLPLPNDIHGWERTDENLTAREPSSSTQKDRKRTRIYISTNFYILRGYYRCVRLARSNGRQQKIIHTFVFEKPNITMKFAATCTLALVASASAFAPSSSASVSLLGLKK